MSRSLVRVHKYKLKIIVQGGRIVGTKMPPSTVAALRKVIGPGKIEIDDGLERPRAAIAGRPTWLGAGVHLDVEGAFRELRDRARTTKSNGTGRGHA